MKQKWIWFVLLILSFTFGVAFTAFADDHLTPAHEILSDGKILHKEVHYQKDHPLYKKMYKMSHNNQMIQIVYIVIYQKEFFNCAIWHEEYPQLNTPYLANVTCRLMNEYPTLNIMGKK